MNISPRLTPEFAVLLAAQPEPPGEDDPIPAIKGAIGRLDNDLSGARAARAYRNVLGPLPYRRAMLKGVLPPRLWKHVAACGEPDPAGNPDQQRFLCSAVAYVIARAGQEGLSHPALDRARGIEERLGKAFGELARYYRARGLVPPAMKKPQHGGCDG